MCEVENPYRVAVKSAWDQAWLVSEQLKHVLDPLAEFLPQAWTGGSSSDMISRLGMMQEELRAAVWDADWVFDQAWSGQPVMVDEEAWQTHWQTVLEG